MVQIPTGIAVIADHYWAARQTCNALKIEWDTPANSVSSGALLERYQRISREQGVVSQEKGDAVDALQRAHKAFERIFTVPFLAHAPMEPLNCTVKNDGDHCEVWAGNQSPLLYQRMVAALLGIPVDQVKIHTPFIGGSFGRKASFDGDWIIEAVHIAKTSGRCIKLVWSREDDIRGGYYRPVYLHRVKIGVDASGYPVSWYHHIVGQSVFTNTILEKAIVQHGVDYSSVDGVNWSPYLADIADHRVELHTTQTNVPVLSWRSVGNTHTCFVMESLIDELAHLAGKDPVEYRKVLLKDHPRHLAALSLAAEQAGWGSALPPGRYRGGGGAWGYGQLCGTGNGGVCW